MRIPLISVAHGLNMHTPDFTWMFSSHFDAQRKAKLEAVSDFNVIIDRIVSEARLSKFEVCRGKEGSLKSCLRPQFELAVSADTADLFFNSPVGYRAQYLMDADEGQRHNGRLLRALRDKLLAFASTVQPKHPMNAKDIEFSLLACSAKAWLPEASFCFNHDLIEDIPVPLWRRNALSALEAFGRRKRPEPEKKEKAIWGLRAPRVSAIDVKGAFLTPSDKAEVVPFDKITRRYDIRDYGYA